ncbi:MAG: hypothetical protein A2047_04545 [Omnitrophica bacterium GWA2_41_15]|nr:MAG: hypothetical protein A2047_04545 [Omnitrophica bacterium GWA2_41_15]HAZ10063.1 hypothetical protein [Candidatus Omnitrophota bacterium]
MKSQEKAQSDLFEEAQTVDKKIKRKTRFFLPDAKNSFTVSYETMIFFMIGFVMVCIIVFSLGVEKGRYDEKKTRVMIPQQVTRDIQPQPKAELKKGASNVATSKPKNIKSR